jgi:hypothetical protein
MQIDLDLKPKPGGYGVVGAKFFTIEIPARLAVAGAAFTMTFVAKA